MRRSSQKLSWTPSLKRSGNFVRYSFFALCGRWACAEILFNCSQIGYVSSQRRGWFSLCSVVLGIDAYSMCLLQLLVVPCPKKSIRNRNCEQTGRTLFFKTFYSVFSVTAIAILACFRLPRCLDCVDLKNLLGLFHSHASIKITRCYAFTLIVLAYYLSRTCV